MNEVTVMEPRQGSVEEGYDVDFGTAEPQIILKYKVGKSVYLLREPSAAAVVAYRRATMRGATMTDGTITGLDGAADSEPVMVARCSFELLSGNETGERPVEEKAVRAWRGDIQNWLFNKIKEKAPYITPGEETEDGLRKEIEKLNKKLAKILVAKSNGREVEGSAKN